MLGVCALDTRERIISAAAEVIRERGLARATTKQIAKVAGVSEGSLYNHFEGKEEIFLAVLGEQLPEFISLIRFFPERAGSENVEHHLRELAFSALAFYNQSIPMGASIFSETELLKRHREMLAQRGAGPHRANQSVAEYLRREQEMGRINRRAVPRAGADLILGACYQRAYWTQFLGEELAPDDEAFIQQTVATLMCALVPSENSQASPEVT